MTSAPKTDEEKGREEEEENPNAPAPLIDVGYHLDIPISVAARKRTLGAYGLRPEPEHHAIERRAAWCEKLDAYAKTFDPTMRVMPQPTGTDFLGFDTWPVIIWSKVSGEDIESGRVFLYEGGYDVTSISLNYTPPMA